MNVAPSILDNINRLMADAKTSLNAKLCGSGGRSSQRQIELRRAHCGPTEFDIYKKRASLCRPPTAIPGRSMHEQGLAIDFTCNGQSIKSRSGPCWDWLVANAGRYGLKNLQASLGTGQQMGDDLMIMLKNITVIIVLLSGLAFSPSYSHTNAQSTDECDRERALLMNYLFTSLHLASRIAARHQTLFWLGPRIQRRHIIFLWAKA